MQIYTDMAHNARMQYAVKTIGYEKKKLNMKILEILKNTISSICDVVDLYIQVVYCFKKLIIISSLAQPCHILSTLLPLLRIFGYGSCG